MSHKFHQIKWKMIFSIIIIFIKVTNGIEVNDANKQITSQAIKEQLLSDTMILSKNNTNITGAHSSNNTNLNKNIPDSSQKKQISNITSNNSNSTVSSTKIIKENKNDDENAYVVKNLKNLDFPDSYRIGFYIFIGVGLLAVIFFVCKSYK